jgi:uncharacterized membrane protein (GlpM family)
VPALYDAAMDPFWLALLAKMLTSAVIVVAASLVVERTGPFVGAMVATLPISAGPAYAFLAAEHGPAFVGESALVSLGVNAATGAFVVAYAVLAKRYRLAVSLGGAALVWGLAAWAVFQAPPTLPVGLALNIAVYGAGIALTRQFVTTAPAGRVVRLWWDVPLRAAGVMTLVGVVVAVGRLLGPGAAGIAALVPIVMTSLALILQPRIGGPATAAVFVHSLPGLVGFGLAIAVLHVAAVPLGVVPALLLGLATCIVWNTSLMFWKMRAARLPRPAGMPRPSA